MALFRYSSACATICARMEYMEMVLENSVLTWMVSAPIFRKYAAASNVRTPVRMTKFLVSSMIPARSASAYAAEISVSSRKYCMISVTISDAEDA